MFARPAFVKTLLTLACLALPAAANAVTEIRVGIDIDDVNSGAIDVRRFIGRLRQGLEIYLGEAVELSPVIVRSEAEILDGLISGRIDFSRLDAGLYLKSRQNAVNLELLAIERDRAGDDSASVICVRAENGIEDLADLRGRSMAFGAEGSAAGHYLPQRRLALSGLKAFNLSKFRYVGQQRKIGLAVAAGVFDAGVIDRRTFAELIREGRRLHSIADLGRVDRPWVAGPGLGETAVHTLRRVLPSLEFEGFDFNGASMPGLQTIGAAIDENRLFFNHAPI